MKATIEIFQEYKKSKILGISVRAVRETLLQIMARWVIGGRLRKNPCFN